VPLPPDPLQLELHWSAPPTCPDADELEQRIAALLPVAQQGEGTLRIDAVVVEEADGFTLTLSSTFRGLTEQRDFRSHVCTELVDTTALLVAIALEPGAIAVGSRPPEPTAVESRTPADPASAAPAPAKTTVAAERRSGGHMRAIASGGRPFRERPRRRPEAIAIRFAGGLEVGALPPPTAALHGGIGLLWPRARAEIHGSWLAPRTRVVDGAGARYQLGAAGARGCGRFFVRDVELPLCVGAEGGVSRARPRGLASDRPVLAPWLGVIASFGVARAWGPVAIWSAAEVAVRAVGSRFWVGSAVSVAQLPVSVRLLLGIEVRAPWKRGGRGH